MRIAVALALATFLGGCTAIHPASAPATLQTRLLVGRADTVRIEVHVTPLQDLHTATLRLQAHGWRVQPDHYTLDALRPPVTPPRSGGPRGPYGRPRSILRTFILEPIAHATATATATSAMLELQTPDGTIRKIIALNSH